MTSRARQHNIATAIKIGDRYFAKIQKGRVYTAWHIAGAMLFHDADLEMQMIDRLEKKGKKLDVVYFEAQR